MKNKVGKIFANLRNMKHLTLKEVTSNEFSLAQESKFERGETSLTIDKFLLLLQNTQISLDEFQDFYDNYSLSKEYNFHDELREAHRIKDLNKIKKWLKYWKEKSEKNSDKKYFKLNYIVSRVSLASTSGGNPSKIDIDFLTNYLDLVEQWGRYEIWIFSICQHYLDDNLLDYYGTGIFGKSNYYRNVQLNQQMVIRTMLNLVDTWLYRKKLGKALIYLNHVKIIGIPIELFEEAITLRYLEGHYCYLLGDLKGKQMMQDCAKDIEKYGYTQAANELQEEIDNLEML
jgi:transcriptional activator, Rgg/GadR/MutR family, C-terminal domain